MYPLYTKFAYLYDLIYSSYLEKSVPRIIDFIEEIFRKDAKRKVTDILDIACGTGGPTVELAKRGYNVLGLDISQQMIDIAKEKATRLGLEISFQVGDMRHLEFKERFDAVTCIFTSLNYNTSSEDMLNTLKGVYNSLRPGGVFIADCPNPLRSERWIEGIPYVWRVDKNGKNILIIDAVIMDTVSLLVDWRRTIIVNGENGLEMYPDYHKLRLYTANELKLLGSMAGFRTVKIYGDLKITTEEPRDAKRLIMVAIKE